jgi:hypothetical protein
MRAHSLDLSTNVSLAHDLARFSVFSGHARAPKRNVPPRRAALFELYGSALRFSTTPMQRPAPDSLSPQAPILREKLLVAVHGRLQTLAGESLHIVAFG